jgi:hypothetical protein
MSTTNINFNTSNFIANTPGITWMEAVFVNNGSIQSTTNLFSGSATLPVTTGNVSGRIYILAGSGTPPTFTSESQIIPNSLTGQYRFIVYELNLQNNPADVLDVTAINGIGFNGSAESVFSGGVPSEFSGSQLPYNTAGNSLTSQIENPPISNTNAVQSNASGWTMIYGPSGNPGENYWPASYWNTYVQQFENTPSVLNGMEFGGIYGIPASAGGGYQVYDQRAFVTTYQGQQGIMLYPVPLNVALPAGVTQYNDWIFVSNTSLVNNIYQPGLGAFPVTIFSGGPNGPASSQALSTTPPYNAAAIITTALVSGFDAGFYGSTGTSPNPNVKEKLDLNQNWNFGWNYAYQGQLNSATPSNGTSLGSLAVGSVFNNGNPTPLNGGYYDPFSAVISKYTNVYAWPYSDFLATWGGTAPVIGLYDKNLNSNVETLNFTVYGDATQQPATNFIAPAVGYIAPPGNVFSAATFATNNSLQFPLTFGGVVPDQNTPITFRIYAPGQKNSDTQGFITLQLNGLFQTGGNFSDWGTFNITAGSPSTPWTVSSGGTSGATGILNINNVPVVQNGEAWYQFILGAGADATTYNIYAITNAAGQFTQMIVDHSATAVSNSAGTPPLSAPNSEPTASAKVLLTATNVTFDPAVYAAPRISHFSDGPLQSDVILTDANNGLLANWRLNAQGDVGAGSGQLSLAMVAGWNPVGTGKFGAGAATDLLMASTDSSGNTHLATWTVNGTTITPNTEFGQLPLGWSVVGTGDFIGAGKANQILLEHHDSATNLNQLAFWQVTNEGTIAANGNVGGPLGNGWAVAGVGNILGDGRSDVLLQNGSQLAIWEFNNQGQVTNGASINSTITPGYSVAGLGYFTNGSHEDILFQNGNQLAMWQMQGFEVANGANFATLLPGWAVAGIGDYNASGTSDILLQNGNQFVEWLMNGMTVTNSVNVNSQLSTGWNLLGTGNLG